MNEKKVCKAEIDTLFVELLLKDEEEENDVAHAADYDEEEEEDQCGHQDTGAETRKSNYVSGKSFLFKSEF